MERLVLRLAAARERREGRGGAALSGGGEEFVGYRPYRPGEDPRQLDWSLFARLDQPYVRTTRREAAEEWAILLDTSGSMGVGPPGKLQLGAELCLAFASIGLRQGAHVQVRLPGSGTTGCNLGSVRDLPTLVSLLTKLRATGAGPDEDDWLRAVPTAAGRVFLVGDWLDLEPRFLGQLRGRRREGFLAQILAPIELQPPMDRSVQWVCPESGERVSVNVDAPTLAAYCRALELDLEAWSSACSRHGFGYGLFSTERPFEEAVEALLL